MSAVISEQALILVRVALAMVLGGVIGLEREIEDKPAGLRTHMLVAGASALFVALGNAVVGRWAMVISDQLVQSDPVRIIQAVVTGVSFLGAGTIMRHRGDQRIEGLTTAASVLFTAAMGVCTALAQYVLAAGAAILVLIALRGVIWAERWVQERRTQQE
jgi:putative Mg2+ transporter-C (MgtC) family protein